MSLLKSVQLATNIFLKVAYPNGIPSDVSKKAADLDALKTDNDLFQWDMLERERTRYHFRLGNLRYPHMKLVFMVESGRPVFYVDAHDSHFNLPPNVPGYEKLLELRVYNQKLKEEAESKMAQAQLYIFGRQTEPAKTGKRICQGMKILAVDDEEQILDMLEIIVKSLGAEMLRALTVEAARDMIDDAGQPDLIFCDIMMPDQTGYEFVTWLRARGYIMPVYFITGLSLEKIDRSGVTAVLQKPFTAKSVMQIIKSVRKAQP